MQAIVSSLLPNTHIKTLHCIVSLCLEVLNHGAKSKEQENFMLFDCHDKLCMQHPLP